MPEVENLKTQGAYTFKLERMPYDERLADRIRAVLDNRSRFTELKMFGGIAFMLNGNLCCGVLKDDLILRLGPEQALKALGEPHTREFDLTGRPMKGMIIVSPSGYASEDSLRRWLEQATDFTSSLPPKESKRSQRQNSSE